MSETNEKKCDIENETNNDAEDDVVEENSELVLVEEETSLELTSVSLEIPTGKKKKKKTNQRKKRANTVIHVNIKFCTHVGCQGVVVMLSLLGVAGLFGFIASEYTGQFNSLDREFVWMFIVIGLIYTIAFIWLAVRWKNVAKDYTKRATGLKRKGSKKNALFNFYTNTFINGPYFLWKLYIFEFCESLNQLNNFFFRLFMFTSYWMEFKPWYCFSNR
jgi:hypothetical protein